MSDRLFERMLRVPSNKVEWLGDTEAKELGLIGEDPAFAEWRRAKAKSERSKMKPETAKRFDQEDRFADCLKDRGDLVTDRDVSECRSRFPKLK